MLKRFLETGQIVTTHGLKGEVRVIPWSDTPDFLLAFDRFFFDRGDRYMEVESSRVHKSLVIIKFSGVDSLEQAMPLLRQTLYIDRSWVELPEGSYFEQDLIGLKVIHEQTGKEYGQITAVSKTGANDVYHILRPEGGEVLIPAIPDVIRSIDLDGAEMKIIPLKGLFSDED